MGQYQVTVTPTCRGVTQAVSFEVEIRPSTNPLFIALPLVAGGLLVGVWLYRQWTSQQTANHPVKKRTSSP
ncbi:MAG: hypothetical protein HC804_03600 [Anaerolineae bacterium]|nr:hypothetical protein [Anaerolineae bacterium]